jgi:hypothetical protein
MAGSTLQQMECAGKSQALLQIARQFEELARQMTEEDHEYTEEHLLPRTIESLQKTVDGLRGPHGMLHELVAMNWDASALRCLLESNILEALSERDTLSLDDLVECSGIPKDKLWRIMRLLVCRDFVCDSSKEYYTLSPASAAIAQDDGLKAFLKFQ